MTDDMVHSRKEGLVHSGLTASIPGGDEAGGAGHTPWSYEFVEESSDWVVFGAVSAADETGMTFQPAICTLSASCDETEARLIAAAPDLLEAANAALGALTGNMDGDWIGQDPIAMLRSAIAKAVGDVKRDADPIHRRDGDAASVGVNQASSAATQPAKSQQEGEGA